MFWSELSQNVTDSYNLDALPNLPNVPTKKLKKSHQKHDENTSENPPILKMRELQYSQSVFESQGVYRYL